MVKVIVGGETYYMNPKMKEKWDSLKDGKLTKKDEDRVYIVDGRERSGKSVWSLQQAAYVDSTLVQNVNRICFTPEEFLSAIRKTQSDEKNTKCIIFDEAFRGLSSRSALSKTNKYIIQALMEVGQKNLILFIVLPSFFMLDKYAAILRSNTLFHIKKEKKKRVFRVFNYKQKALLYNIGMKKGWGYNVPTRYKDSFSNRYPGGKGFELIYREKKLQSLNKEDPLKENVFDKREFITKMFENIETEKLDITISSLNDILKVPERTLRDYRATAKKNLRLAVAHITNRGLEKNN